MPSRGGIAFIICFWLATVGYVGYRDVWPRLVRDSAPTVWIDLSDEATQTVPVRWALYRNDARAGTVTTQMVYDAAKDQFHFQTKYRDFQLEVPPIRCVVPEMQQTTVLTRSGQLGGQSLNGTLIAKFLGQEVARGTARIDCVVREGELVGHCRLESDFFESIEEPLDPTPVPDGQVLNPLQPVNRLRGVRAGLRWMIYKHDPLGDALANATKHVLKKKGIGGMLFAPKPTERESLIATVSDTAETVKFSRGEQRCWTIDIRGERATMTVWVREADGYVMRQVANVGGETLRLERED
jgi:hypothetical protein